MAVSDEDKAKMRRLGEALDELETEQSPEQRQRLLAWINATRAEIGMPPLKDEHEERPEEGFYRRAKALGMVRRDRQSP